MHKLVIALIGAVSITAGSALAAPTHIRAELLAETMTPAPGSTVTLALRMDPERGFHGYWLNPGDAGFPLIAKWTLPPGATIGVFDYPMPQRLVIAGMMNHVYESRYALLTSLRIPRDAKPGSVLPVQLDARWLACSAQSCMPESQSLQLLLRIGDGAMPAASTAAFASMRGALPARGTVPARFERVGKVIRIAIPVPVSARTQNAWFFPSTKDATIYAAPQKMTRTGSGLILETKAGAARDPEIKGVLVLSPALAYSVAAHEGSIAAPCEGGQAATW